MYDKAFDLEFTSRKSMYEQAVRKFVCEHCIDFGQDNVCHKATGPEKCTVIKNLKEMVYIAKSVKSTQLSPYVQTVREKVCTHCSSSRPDGSCPSREEIDCCLDRYLPLVLQAVEYVDSQ